MKALIKRNLEGRKVLLFFLLTNAVFGAMIFYSIPKLMAYSGGLRILDMMPAGYDFPYVKSLFTALGKEGRAAYLTLQLPLDMLYPGLFGVSYALLMGYFLKKTGKLETWYFKLVYLPLIAAFFDYLENIGIFFLLNSYPALPPSLVSLTSIVSVLKSVLSAIFFVTLILIFLAFIRNLVFRKPKLNTSAKIPDKA
ncbi:MAG TPA: hypothetical protein VK927_07340 [Adhaeribacter sp.]|nr:hypothetical protein [Adhaeribacter sp.]